MPKRKPGDNQEKTLESKYIFKGRVVNLRVDNVITSDGRHTTREIVEHPACIAVIPLDTEDNILMVSQYRTPVKKILLEIPAGGIEKGEDVKAAVMREMQEEIGFKPKKLVFLAGFYSSAGFCDEYLHLYLATDLIPSRLHAEDTAEIKLVRVPVKQALGMIKSGKIQDAKSVAGILLLLEYRRTRQSP
jgi:ADP-ribose pyrophosphatase